MSDKNLFAIILAGGSGCRLWPLSRDLHPKQLMKFTDDHTLFESAFIRLVNNVDDKNIITATNVKHESEVKHQLEHLQEKFCRSSSYRVISEPVSKNTAPAIALGMKYIANLTDYESDPVIIVTPSDNVISNQEKFTEQLNDAIKLAQENYIVSFGVKPTKPDTGYGYIKTKKNKKLKDLCDEALKVDSFIEKPAVENAQDFINSKNYFWNSGIYVFKMSVLLEEFQKYCPEIFNIIADSEISSQSPTINFVEFDKMPDISIDYAVMEYTNKLAVIPLECEWKDLGSWDAIYEISPKDENGNSKQGNVIDIDSKNSMIYSTSKLVATIGLENMIVIETEDAFLVTERSKAPEVKKIVSILKEKDDNTHSIHKTVHRPWGWYTVLNEGDGFLTKCIQVNPGGKLSLQLHHHRAEHWVILEGNAVVVKGEETLYLDPGDSVDIDIEELHSLQNPYEKPIKVLEVQKGKILDENDIVRVHDIYGRA